MPPRPARWGPSIFPAGETWTSSSTLLGSPWRFSIWGLPANDSGGRGVGRCQNGLSGNTCLRVPGAARSGLGLLIALEQRWFCFCLDAMCVFEPRSGMMQLPLAFPLSDTWAGFSKIETNVTVSKSRSGFLLNLTFQALVASGKQATVRKLQVDGPWGRSRSRLT